MTDFGIARALSSPDDDLTQAGSVMGTATYFSPEQAQGLAGRPAGPLLARCRALRDGHRPPAISGDTPLAIAYRHVQDQPAPPSTLISGLPGGIEAIIMKLLQKSPDGRYASAEDLRVDLGRYLNGEVTLAEQEAAGFVASATQVQAATTAQAVVPEDEYYPEDEEPEKPRTAAFIGVLVVLLAIFGGLLAWFLVSSASAEKVAVPSVIGSPQAEAERAIRDVGLKPEVEMKASDFEAGIVLSQDPGKDVDVDKGSTVKIVVSSRCRGHPGPRCPDTLPGRGRTHSDREEPAAPCDSGRERRCTRRDCDQPGSPAPCRGPKGFGGQPRRVQGHRSRTGSGRHW